MTITPTPEQERILGEAMDAGLIQRPEEALNLGLDTLRSRLASPRRSETAEEWIARFHDFVHSHSTSTPLLSDEAISRKSIYDDRGL
jgi:hypothetical protein